MIKKPHPHRKHYTKLSGMYLISILDVNNILELNQLGGVENELVAVGKVDRLIKGLSDTCKVPIQRVKIDKYEDVLSVFYHMYHGVIEVTLSDITNIEFFITDRKVTSNFKQHLVNYFKEYIDDENQFKGVFIDSIQIFKKNSEVASPTEEKSKISTLFERSANLFLISIGIFAIIEILKAVLTEWFAITLDTHRVVVIIVIAVAVAFLFKPLERVSNHIISKIVFRKTK
jgi:hypothetical protein